MGRSLIHKIIDAHLAAGVPEPGREIAIAIDQTLTQDATGTMAYLQFEAMKAPRVATESFSYIDHNTLQDGFENADDHRYLRAVADKFGITFSRAGNGICHQVHVERFARPGLTLLGTDSHTPTSGGVGCLALGVGGLDAAAAMAGRPYWLECPRVVRVRLTGALPPWSSAKDLALELLRLFTTKGNVGAALEFDGPGLAALSVPERATVTNMGTELGVTTSIFPSDEATLAFFMAQGREGDWRPLAADPDAEYERTVEIDLGSIEPLAACPHSPDNVKPVRELAGLPVDQVLIGSCTNSSHRDVSIVAAMLRGRKIPPSISLGVAPGSRQVLEMAAGDGRLADLIGAGARVLETACGFCVGAGQAPGSGAVSVRTNNRNFEGRSGTKDARVFLASPETAAASALAGKLVDPRDLGLPYPEYRAPERYLIDDGMIVASSLDQGIEIPRGPNIGPPPSPLPMPDPLLARVAIRVGDKVTTDHIMPAGALLKYRSNVPKYSRYVFRDLESRFAEICDANKAEGVASAIVAGLSYGQGSSREHAALCPMHLGVRLLLARSVERIHAANLVNFGILALTLEDEGDYAALEPGDLLSIEGLRALPGRRRIPVLNRRSGRTFSAACPLTERQMAIVLAGGAMNFSGK